MKTETRRGLVHRLDSLYECCQEALDDRWDRSDEGFEAVAESALVMKDQALQLQASNAELVEALEGALGLLRESYNAERGCTDTWKAIDRGGDALAKVKQ